MKHDDHTIEDILKTIDFPGENRSAIEEYLESHHFTDTVMSRINELHESDRNSIFWLLFILLNVILMVVVGGNRYLLFDVLGLHRSLSQIFFLFLGLTLMGGLIGFVLTFDTKKLKKVLRIS